MSKARDSTGRAAGCPRFAPELSEFAWEYRNAGIGPEHAYGRLSSPDAATVLAPVFAGRARSASRRCSSSPRCGPTSCRAISSGQCAAAPSCSKYAGAQCASGGVRLTRLDAAKRATPAVVNYLHEQGSALRRRSTIACSGAFSGERERATRPGSGVIVARRLRAHQSPRRRGADDIELVLTDGRACLRGDRRRSGVRPRGAAVKADKLAAITFGTSRRCRSATSCSRSATRSASANGDLWHRVRARPHASASTASRTSSRPTRRSTRATPAARWSTRAAT